MVVVLAAFAAAADAVARTWSGPANGDWFNPANWNPSDNCPQAGESVSVTNGSILLTNATAELGSFEITNATLTFTNWSTSLQATNVTIWNLGILTHVICNTNAVFSNSNRVYILCTNLDIRTGGKIDVVGKGYPYRQGNGAGYDQQIGGGYGGAGGNASGAKGGVYGLTNAPLDPGSGGGQDGNGGNGGGVVRIVAGGGTVVVEGLIDATGDPGHDSYRGGGSGGAIYIDCQKIIGTNGILRANGGAGTANGGGGGGGRIAVIYDPAEQAAVIPKSTISLTVFGGATVNTPGTPGTLFFPDTSILQSVLPMAGYLHFGAGVTNWQPDSLTISNSHLGFAPGFVLTVTNTCTINTGKLYYSFTTNLQATVTVGGNLVLTNGSAFYLYPSVTNASTASYGGLLRVAGELYIATNCVLYPYSDNTNGGSIKLVVSNLTVAGGGTINAAGKGYRYAKGPGADGVQASGGSHGGIGGNCSRQPYGSTNAPRDPGSGGGQDGYGGYGGGVVWVMANSGAVRVDGLVDANGTGPSDSYRGGGSGGSIFIACRTFAGTNGVIRANGGVGSANGGSGAGGRIAIGVGFNDVDVDNLVAGLPVLGFVTSQTWQTFSGTFTATNGATGNTLGTPGTARFMSDRASNLTVYAVGATGIGITNAMLNGKLNGDGGDANTAVAFCYGYSDAGTASTGAWPNVVTLGGGWAAVTFFSNAVHNLISGSSCVYRCYATNTTGSAWSSTQGFTTIYVPSVTNLGCAGYEGVYSLRGQVTDVGASPQNPYCWFYYWPVGGSTTVVAMGQQALLATFSTNLAGLPLEAPYQYRVLVSNEAGTAWSAISDFTTEYYLAVTKTWIGSSDPNWFTATNWSPNGVPVGGDSVLVASQFAAANVLLTNSTAQLGQLVISNRTLTCSNWPTMISATNIIIRTNGTFTHSTCITNTVPGNTNRVFIQCSNLTIQAGGKIDVVGKGYPYRQGPGQGYNQEIGGGHGGQGGNSYGSYGGMYGSINAPIHPGSGGGQDGNGGNGGGVVQIVSSGGTVRVDGTIDATGDPGHDGYRGGGSGGSIHIGCRIFSGSNGNVRANGGAGTSNGGGGGGGRIAVEYDPASQAAVNPSVVLSVLGGTTVNTPGTMGTLYLTDTLLLRPVLTFSGFMNFPAVTNWAVNALVISNAYAGFQANFGLKVTNDLTITAGGRLTLTNSAAASGYLDVGGSLSLVNTSRFYCYYSPGCPASLAIASNLFLTNGSSAYLFAAPTNSALTNYGGLLNLPVCDLVIPTNCAIYPYSHPANGGSVKMVVGSLTVSGGGSINADYKGFAGTLGYGAGTAAGGGGYGGLGGCTVGGPVYGASNAPLAPGSGGATGGGSGGAGGGLVWVQAAGPLLINGSIQADGVSTRCGGSGGGIFLTGKSFAGTGTIHAVGGGCDQYGGAGGGGRIAILVNFAAADLADFIAGSNVADVVVATTDPAFTGTLSATNGVSGNVSYNGYPGTCFIFTKVYPKGAIYTFF